jgi:hypothetical protein
MDETSLRAMFERAVAERPPTPRLVPDSVRAGMRLRKRRRIEAAAGSVAAVALISVMAAAVAGAFSPGAMPPVTSAGGGFQTAYIWTGASTVTPVRLSTGKVLTPLRVPGVIQDIDATPDGRAVYVFSNTETSSLFNYVTRINSATGKASGPIRLTGNSLVQMINDVQIAPGGKLAYANESGSWPANSKYGASALVAINLVTGAQRKLAEPGGWVIAPGGRTAYAAVFSAAGSSRQVNALDLATGTLLPPIKLKAPGNVYSVAFGPGRSTIYAMSVARASASGASRGSAWVTPISTATNIAARPIEVQSPQFIPDVAIAPDGESGYVSGGQYVYPISLADGKALKPIKLPRSFELYISTFEISPSSKFGYDWQPRSASVQLINLAAGSVLRPVALPGGYRQAGLGVFAGGSAVYVPASIYRGALPSLGALFPLQLATQHLGKPIFFSGVPNGVVLVP